MRASLHVLMSEHMYDIIYEGMYNLMHEFVQNLHEGMYNQGVYYLHEGVHIPLWLDGGHEGRLDGGHGGRACDRPGRSQLGRHG